jgi:hypothetical protein
MVKLHRVDEWPRLPLGGVRRLLGVARRECRHGALEKCAQLMRAATGQDVEIMLGVHGTILRVVVLFCCFFFLRAPVHLNKGHLASPMYKSQDTRTMGAFSLFVFY